MYTFAQFQKMHGGVLTQGQANKRNSDMLMEATWDRDLATRTMYLYDYDHDSFITQLRDLHPEKDKHKIPISAKYIVSSSQTYAKDQITYHLQLRPSQECNVPYYKEVLEDRYEAIFPCGLYVDIEDNKGKFNRWLVVGLANYYDPQFSTYEILPCDHVFQWVHDGVKCQMAGVLRSQNSYNSGLWESYRTTSVQDQQKFAVPINSLSETLFYNKRMIIDAKVRTEPRTWDLSKVNRLSARGVVHVTLAQNLFDPVHDYIEYEDPEDPTSPIIGMWADYFKDGLEAVEPKPPRPDQHIVIEHTGVGHKMKIGGNSKVFTAVFYNGDTASDYIENGTWRFSVDGSEASDLVIIEQKEKNQIEISLDADISYIGKDLLVTYTSESGLIGKILMDITTL